MASTPSGLRAGEKKRCSEGTCGFALNWRCRAGSSLVRVRGSEGNEAGAVHEGGAAIADATAAARAALVVGYALPEAVRVAAAAEVPEAARAAARVALLLDAPGKAGVAAPALDRALVHVAVEALPAPAEPGRVVRLRAGPGRVLLLRRGRGRGLAGRRRHLADLRSSAQRRRGRGCPGPEQPAARRRASNPGVVTAGAPGRGQAPAADDRGKEHGGEAGGGQALPREALLRRHGRLQLRAGAHGHEVQHRLPGGDGALSLAPPSVLELSRELAIQGRPCCRPRLSVRPLEARHRVSLLGAEAPASVGVADPKLSGRRLQEPADGALPHQE
mmetsp:Transcript_75823/g.245522  ORF Transcript_75823/g.245522 Transcript_75823/m.245522 type:complete len:331 (+) Transcript_75823:68-1060(+)